MTATWWSTVFWYEQIAKQLNGCEMIKKPTERCSSAAHQLIWGNLRAYPSSQLFPSDKFLKRTTAFYLILHLTPSAPEPLHKTKGAFSINFTFISNQKTPAVNYSHLPVSFELISIFSYA